LSPVPAGVGIAALHVDETDALVADVADEQVAGRVERDAVRLPQLPSTLVHRRPEAHHASAATVETMRVASTGGRRGRRARR
jgi:hypothetical protein